MCLVLAQSILAQTVLSNADSVKIEELSESYSELMETDIQKAEAPLKAALQLVESKYGKENEDYRGLLYEYAGYLRDVGRYDDAIAANTQLRELMKKVEGEEYLYCEVTKDLAYCYVMKGQFKEALTYASEVKSHADDDLDPKSTIKIMAVCNLRLGNVDEAISLSTQVCKEYEVDLEIGVKIDEDDYADAVGMLSTCYVSKRNFPEAIRLAKKEISIKEKLYGTDYENTASAYNDLSLCYSESGEYAEAIAAATKAIAIVVLISATA